MVTQPDKKVGRHQILEPTPIKKIAIENDIPVFQPTKIRTDYQEILDYCPDIIITCAYGQIIPNELLACSEYGAINVHASLLPKLRGGAPLHKSIIYGYKETGITIMYMTDKMDAGDIIEQESTMITDEDNVGTIHDKLSTMGANLLIKTLPSIFNKTNKRIKQDETLVTYAYNITREEEQIDWNKTSLEIFNQIRGLYPYPVAYTTLNNEIIKITESRQSNNTKGNIGQIIGITKEGIEIKCADNSIIITKLKPSGKKEMKAIDFVNGYGKEKLLGSYFK